MHLPVIVDNYLNNQIVIYFTFIMQIPEEGSHNSEPKIRTNNNSSQFIALPLYTDMQSIKIFLFFQIFRG